MQETRRAYFDHAATTALDPRALEAMLPVLQTNWGNPSSIYYEGREARKTLDAARRQVAESLGARPNDIVFTSGGSESDNAAIRGAAFASARRGRHIVTTSIEHHAVLHTVEQLTHEGFEATFLPVDAEGFVDPEELRRALRPDTTVVSVMYANNEVGTVEPVRDLVQVVKDFDRHIVFHTDAVQAVGALDLDVDHLGVDMLSLSGHKFYGPRGAGVLYIRPRTPFVAQTLGGSQERNRRAGTENVAGIVGLATALSLETSKSAEDHLQVRELRDRIWRELPQRLSGVHLTGATDPERRLPNNFSCCVEGVEGEAVLIQMDLNGISASSGSACTTGSLEPSHVLTAMGLPLDLARSSLRLTLGHDNTDADVDLLIEKLPPIVEKLRRLAPRTLMPPIDPEQVFASYDHPSASAEGARAQQIKFCPTCGSGMEMKPFEERPRPVCPKCGYVFFLNPAPGTSVLISDGARILLGKRSEDSFRAGKWCLPGGFIEFEEDFLTTARREVKEEAGIDIEIEAVINVVSYFLSPAFHVIVVVLLAHPVGNEEPKGGDDIDEVAWFGPGDALPELAFEADAHIIARFFKEGRGSLGGVPVDPRYARD